MGSAYQFHSWRVFVVVCALPCVCAVVALTFMPESPRYYLEVMSPFWITKNLLLLGCMYFVSHFYKKCCPQLFKSMDFYKFMDLTRLKPCDSCITGLLHVWKTKASRFLTAGCSAGGSLSCEAKLVTSVVNHH